MTNTNERNKGRMWSEKRKKEKGNTVSQMESRSRETFAFHAAIHDAYEAKWQSCVPCVPWQPAAYSLNLQYFFFSVGVLTNMLCGALWPRCRGGLKDRQSINLPINSPFPISSNVKYHGQEFTDTSRNRSTYIILHTELNIWIKYYCSILTGLVLAQSWMEALKIQVYLISEG